MKTLQAALVIALIHCSYAELLIRGDPVPLINTWNFNAECLLQDSEYTINDVHMEVYEGNEWHPLMKLDHKRTIICYRSVFTLQTENRLVLNFFYVPNEGVSFRCVLDGPNVTAPEYTEPLNVTVHYFYGPQLSIKGDSSSLENNELTVKAGDDVVVKCTAESSEEPDISWYKEGDDWILPFPVLTLNNVSSMDEGRYTCYAQHPTIPSLSNNRTINLSVLSGLQWMLWRLRNMARLPFSGSGGREQADSQGRRKMTRLQLEKERNTYNWKEKKWFEDRNVQRILISAGGVVAILAVGLSVRAFIDVRAKKGTTSKGPIDDHSAKKPIYKSSSESIPITCGDKQPLV